MSKKIKTKCGNCGRKIEIWKYRIKNSKSGKVFCSVKCRAKKIMPPTPNRTGKRPPNYKGRIKRNGYWLLYMPNHPDSSKQGYIREHRLNMQKKLGRRLKKHEIVHHINHVKSDNRPENLMLLSSNKEHKKLHKK